MLSHKNQRNIYIDVKTINNNKKYKRSIKQSPIPEKKNINTFNLLINNNYNSQKHILSLGNHL